MRGITLFLFVLFISTLHSQTITLRDTTNQYDYIIITVPEFVSVCEPFKQHKETVRDFRTLIVDTTQIFAEFDTSAAPQDNIREFISYAGTFWQEPRPKFFLIVGTVQMVPNFEIVFSNSFESQSDYYYSENIFDNDSRYIDFYVGRVPVKNTEEIENYFNKVIDYESNNVLESWMNNALFICQDNSYDFLNFAIGTASRLSSFIRPYYITGNDTSQYYGNIDSIYNAINNGGNSVVWFFGFNKDSLFALTDSILIGLEELNGFSNNQKYFFTFFRGTQSAVIDSNSNLTREMLVMRNAGSLGGQVFVGITFWGASGVCQQFWAQRFFNLSIQSIGEIITIDSLLTDWNTIKVINLWADPSLKLKYDITLDVESPIASHPVGNYSLFQNFPNPFNPITNIGFKISDRRFVSLKVFDVLGNEIATLVNEEKPAGTYEIEFSAANLPSGVYFYKLQAGNFIETRKMILMK